MSFRRPFWLAIVTAGCIGTMTGDPPELPGAGPGDPGSSPGDPGARPGAGGAVTGAGGTSATPGPRGSDVAFTCKPGAAAPAQGWRKLTTAQYGNTLRDLLRLQLGDAGAAGAAMNAAAAALGRMPADEREKLPQDLHGSYRRLDQSLEQAHVDAAYDVALATAAYLTGGGRLGALAGACATDGNAANDADCLTAFITSFGARALRRPLDPDEVAFYRGLYGPTPGSDPAGYADVIVALLTAPQFLYHVEHGDAPVADRPNTYRLDAYELANRLAYHFWDTMPDEPLWTAARSGALLTPEGYAAQVDRVFRDPRTRATFTEFFRDWLKLEDLAPLHLRDEDPVFRAFAGSDLPKPTLRGQMIDEALALMNAFTWQRGAGFDELLSTDLVFPRAPELAALYGVPAWDGMGAPPAAPAGQRPGLFTRAAFLATGSANTRPVMKGVFLRRNVLCDDVPPPPANAMANANVQDLDPRLSTRQLVERLTEAPGSTCAACHAELLNPLGFASEGFDALGRVRREQILYDAQGKETGRVPVDTRSVPQVEAGDETMSAGAADLMRLVAGSGKAPACFARNYFRFSFGRWEDVAADGCLLERLRQVTARGGSIADLLREVALSPEFQQRSFGP